MKETKVKVNNSFISVNIIFFFFFFSFPDTMCVNKTFSSRLKKWLYANWSYSTAFYPGENYFSTIFEYRVKQAMGLNPGNGGKFQITSYPKGIGTYIQDYAFKISNNKSAVVKLCYKFARLYEY